MTDWVRVYCLLPMVLVMRAPRFAIRASVPEIAVAAVFLEALSPVLENFKLMLIGAADCLRTVGAGTFVMPEGRPSKIWVRPSSHRNSVV